MDEHIFNSNKIDHLLDHANKKETSDEAGADVY